jgi:hypothetical protein
MRRTFLLTLTVAIILAGCREEDNPYKDFEKERLAQLATEKYEAIHTLAQAVPCTDPADWKIAAINSICGISHLAYHQNTDEKRLQGMIRDYNALMEVYRPYIAPLVDCPPQRKPIAIACENGKAVVQYREYQAGR